MTTTRADSEVRSGSFVAGRWLPPEADSHLTVVDPALAEPIARFTPTPIEVCVTAVDAASEALMEWAEASPRSRAEILGSAYRLMIDERDALAELIVRENGKALADAVAEVDYAAEFLRWFAEEAVRVHGDMRRSPGGGNWIMVTREPAGVALLITPWNYPAAMATRKLAPALAAGCTVILKPALETPLTAFRIVELLQRAGVPPGVVNVVSPSPAGPAVKAMLADARVRVLSFTGSTEVGRLLLAAAAPTVVRCSMELGGNAPFLVLEDADVEDAVAGLMVAKLRNGGSACTAANRVFVAEPLADAFIDAFTEQMTAVEVGHGLAPGVELGALVNAGTRDKVRALVDASVARGSRRVQGRVPDLPGYFQAPTVLTDVAMDDPVLEQEIFGPVAPIVRFDDLDHAIEAANTTHAGLIAYAYTRDLDRALEVSRRLRAGMVGLNRGVVSDPAAPFGGVKQSGLGREGASEGIQEFLDVKYTALDFH